MTNQDNARPFTIWHVLALNRHILWQLTIGATMAMLSLSLLLTGAPVGGLVMALGGVGCMLWGGNNLRYLRQHDLPLLQRGTLVAARVTGLVKESDENLYRITYRPPGESAERLGVFLAANDLGFAEGEPVAIMIDPANPAELVEVSGRYERLFEKKHRNHSGEEAAA